MDESFFSRSARAGSCSSMSITSEAWTIETLAGSSPARRRTVASSPTRISRSRGFARAWSSAPGTTSLGPWSPPIASTAIVTSRPPSGAVAEGDGLGRSNAATTSGGGVGRGLLQLDRLAALVPAAVRADVMRQLLLVTMLAFDELRHAQRQVRTTLTLAGMRDASLGNSHGP